MMITRYATTPISSIRFGSGYSAAPVKSEPSPLRRFLERVVPAVMSTDNESAPSPLDLEEADLAPVVARSKHLDRWA